MASPALATSEPPTMATPDWAGEIARLKAENAALKHQLEWFKRQLFGAKSERRHRAPPPEQMSLGEGFGQAQQDPAATRPVAAHERRRRQRGEGEEPALFFDPARVPVETIVLPNPAIADLPPEAYTVIGEKVTHRLAQRPGSYVVLKYVRPVVKLTHSATLSCPSAPAAVLEGGRADVSFLAGLVIDKFLYHLPLYRQHQRLSAAGIEVSRQWLTQQVLAVALLLAPIVAAMLEDIRACRVKAMDETPIKAGRKGKGKLKTGYFWPIWGDTDDGGGGDIVFLYRASRAAIHVREALGERVRAGMVLLSDGYQVYAQYAACVGIALAQCWAHTRRGFERAKDIEPEASAEALERIGVLYRIEAEIRTQGLAGAAKRADRQAGGRGILRLGRGPTRARGAVAEQSPDQGTALRPRAPRGLEPLPRRSRRAYRHQPSGASAAPDSDGSQVVAVLLERGRRRGGGHPPEPHRHLPSARHRPLRLSGRCPATHRPPSGQRRPPAHPAALEAALRRQPPALGSEHHRRLSPQPRCPFTLAAWWCVHQSPA
jgi:transposase